MTYIHLKLDRQYLQNKNAPAEINPQVHKAKSPKIFSSEPISDPTFYY